MDELLAKIAGLMKSQQGQDAGLSDVSADAEESTVGFTHGDTEYMIALEEA